METALKGQDNEVGNIRGGRIDGKSKLCLSSVERGCLVDFDPQVDVSGESLRDVWTRVSITS